MKNIIKSAFFYSKKYSIDKACNSKIKKINNNTNAKKLDSDLERDYLEKWSAFRLKPSILFLRNMVSISGISSSYYVPENIYYEFIEPTLNNRLFSYAYNDKNFSERLLPEFKNLFPDVILRSIAGSNFDQDYNYLTNTDTLKLLLDLPVGSFLILKPSIDTGGGNKVTLVERTKHGYYLNGLSFSADEFLAYIRRLYDKNFILQTRITQLSFFGKFNASSLNTIRLFTYRSVANEEVIPLHAYLRFGQKGSLVDSSSQGGLTIGILPDGSFNNFALGRYGEKYFDLDCIQNYKGKKVPHFHEIRILAKKIAPYYFYHRFLGFDFTVDVDNSIRLLEVNNKNIGIINQQMNTGSLFGEYTDEVIDYSLKNEKTFLYHFRI